MAILNGVDILDTNIWWFGGGSAAPAIELIYVFCQKLGIEVGADMTAVGKIRKELYNVRKNLAAFDLNKDRFPKEFDPLTDTLPAEVDAQFDKAIAAAKAGDEAALLDACHAIEDYFGFPKPNLLVKEAEVPGGMYSNMVAQLKALGAEDLLAAAEEGSFSGFDEVYETYADSLDEAGYGVSELYDDCGRTGRQPRHGPQERQCRLHQQVKPVHIARQRRIRQDSRCHQSRLPRTDHRLA